MRCGSMRGDDARTAVLPCNHQCNAPGARAPTGLARGRIAEAFKAPPATAASDRLLAAVAPAHRHATYSQMTLIQQQRQPYDDRKTHLLMGAACHCRKQAAWS